MALQTAEDSFREAVNKVKKAGGDLSDLLTLNQLHTNLVKNDNIHLTVHTQAESFREKDILPFFARCNELIPEKRIDEAQPKA